MDETSIAAQQDALRPVRQFVGMLAGALAGYQDQTYAGADGYSYNAPYRYQTVGPYGYSVEGTPIAATQNGGLYFSPMVVMLALGAVAVLVLKR